MAAEMNWALRLVLLACCLQLGAFTDDSGCAIELECSECLPDNMPLVVSPRAAGGTVRLAEGEQLVLACPGGKFLGFPLQGELRAVCEAGRYRVPPAAAHHLLRDLGCQESVFEDVLHQVEHCGAPLQGRAYLVRREAGGPRHLAALCYDADRALVVRAHLPLAALPPHDDRAAPLSLLGNFNHMFDASTRRDAETLLANDASLERRLRDLLRREGVALAGQRLAAAALLSGAYFEGQNARAAEFASNRFAAWASVVAGNLAHAQRDAARALRTAGGALRLHAGAAGVASLRAASGRVELYLKPERRFPVPRYVWTVLHDERRRRALAIVVLNDPFVAVGEIREAVFCESVCGRIPWLRSLRRNRNYESPVYGLTFCCAVSDISAVIAEMPRDLVRDVPPGDEGLLVDVIGV